MLLHDGRYFAGDLAAYESLRAEPARAGFNANSAFRDTSVDADHFSLDIPSAALFRTRTVSNDLILSGSKLFRLPKRIRQCGGAGLARRSFCIAVAGSASSTGDDAA